MDAGIESDPQETQDNLLKHVILSRYLPQENKNFMEIGVELMKQMIENVDNLAEWIPSETVELFERLKRVSLECTKSVVSEEIDTLEPGDTFAMFVRCQNCVIMIHVLPDADLDDEQTPNVIVATYPGHFRSSETYNCDSDLELNYPVNAIKVKFSKMLRSEKFANQLCLLCEQLPIEDSKHRNHVTKWLMTVLADQQSTTASANEFPTITKKIRDESLGETHSNYFRRSSYYMSVKVLLQHNLTMQLGASTGKFIYKIVMLKFLIQMCAFYENSDCDAFNIDLLSQMIAKLARRIEKISDIIPKKITKDMADFYDKSIEEAKNTIAIIRGKIDRQIQFIQEEDELNANLRPLTGLDFELDICQRMPTLREYLCERLDDTLQNGSNSRRIPLRRYHTRRHQEGFEQDALIGPTYWTEYENKVLYQMSRKDEHTNVDELHQELINYREYAEEKYKGNAVMTSRMILVHLKLIAVIDRRATIEYPLLKKHRSGINSNIITSLLLPQRSDMETALHLEKYFRMRNESACNPSLIEEKNVGETSFSVNYAQENEEMKKVRDAILKLDENNVQRQKAMWSEGREKVERLRESANRLGCTFRTDRFDEVYHDERCKRCALNRNAQKVRLPEYEHLLPKEEYLQLAIVFELRIPNIIACLRDILCSFSKVCTGKSSTLNIKGNWVECNEILNFNESTSRFVTLGSTKKRRSETIHVDEPFRRMIVQNSFNCTFHTFNNAIPTSLDDNVIKDVCTFKTQGEYLCLQWTLNSTSHTENQVLSRQSECPQNLSLSEYKNFGVLRADGHRLQLRKLFAMIETEALSFEKESVLSLIMQTLWECGARETHSDFSEPKFCLAWIKLLQKLMEQQKDNWMHPYKLLMATLIAVRIFEINDIDAVADKIVHLLISIRAIVWDWIDKIVNVISNAHDPNEANERDLRLKLIYVAITGSLTFFIFPKHKYYGKIFSMGADLRTPQRSWLHFNILMRNNLILYEINEEKLPSNLQVFLRLTEICGLHLESKMLDLMKQDEHEVYEVIKMHWFDAIYAQSKTMSFHPVLSNVCIFDIIIDSAQQIIEIDIITGSFYINGSPISRLPHEILQDESYQRVFGNVALEVQMNAQHRFCTAQRNNGCSYEFQKLNNNIIIITERNEKGSDRELIHHTKLMYEFPFLLVANYSHWWNKDENCVEFRQRIFGQRFASKDAKVDYRLNLQTKHLIDVKTQRPMMDVKSMSYKKIVESLIRLEHYRYIHVLKESSDVASVELQRMKLKFKIDCSNEDEEHGPQLESIEFSGMHISAKQKNGTLYGLIHGLMLETNGNGSAGKRKILLMPHGSIQIESDDTHVSVDIDTKHGIRNPPFYQYQVDDICRQLKASNGSHESWFYLAYLHAVTSHGEIEPFIGISGTERALQILQSAFAWPSSPYEPEAVEMLNLIAKLSPIRKMIENNQKVTWPSNIPPRSAQDSFVFIVKKLLEDSQRLAGLHFNTLPPKELNFETDLSLNERDYRRCLQLQPNLHVSESFIEHKDLKTSLPDTSPLSFSANTQIVSILYHNRDYRVPPALNLMEFLTKRQLLKGMATKECIPNILFHSVYEEFHNLWISLYDAIRKKELNNEEIVLILSLFAHQNKEFGPAIVALQAVAMNPDAFENINPPSVEIFQPSLGTYDAAQLSNLLRNLISSEEPDNIQNYSKISAENELESKLDVIIEKCVTKIAENWPCDWVNFTDEFQDIEVINANLSINPQLAIWNDNRKLYEFIESIEKRLTLLPQTGFRVVLPQYSPFNEPEAQNWHKYNINYDEKIRQNLKISTEVIDKAQCVWIANERELPYLAKDWWTIIDRAINSDESKHLIQAGLFPRSVPSLLLSQILATSNNDPLKIIIGAWAVTIAREQRQKRIEMNSNRPELKASTNRDIENEPHVNWKPCDRPEWLLFEIEQNVTIRDIQIKVAEQMIEPPMKPGVDAKHSVMQLNMGEGKTAVIVPILAAILADGKQACQITVLKSLYSRNLKYLQQYLGGLLNRRIYTFPCRRDIPIAQYIKQILEIYEECKLSKGVILTLPEYRLSMQLKLYESIQKGDIEAAKSFLDLHEWLNANVRNILDESDAILQANYQLIYTVGNQLKPDGDSQRWSVIQAVLQRIPVHMKKLYGKYGKKKIEFDDKYMKNKRVFGSSKNVNHRSDVFIPCRIIDEDIFEQLKIELVEDFLGGRLDIEFREIDESSKKCLKELLIQKTIENKPSHLIENFPLTEQNTIMILSGLLRFEVLKLVLTKRWRVNYGVDAKSQRKMAIPFKAKDIAAEMTEFGHPDVAICFTQLSYYYSGLSDDQLYQLFEILKNKQNGAAIYSKLIQNIPVKLMNRSISSYRGINLDNPNQRDQLLFPLLRFNMHVIDFWLDNAVYPYEAKMFEKKLMCTAWDLCSDQFQHRVTGFSGTNDTKNILPMPIAQNDLDILESTNENVRQILLRPENQWYESLPSNFSGKQILKMLTERNIPVLLDSGALMLELTNEELATEWLKITPEANYDAAVYFDSRDILQTVDRNGIITEFDCSVYRENLNRCLVYLDDVHTRGTDLKFPSNWKACVTLSGEITRDKTVQCCMRMRQLGSNHSICFWASSEADTRLRKICGLSVDNQITNEHVIEFISNNSQQLETTNMVHWTAAALNYTKKLIGHKLFDDTTEESSMEQLYDKCVEDEYVKLIDMYGDKEQALLTRIAWSKFDKIAAEYRSDKEIKSFVRSMQDSVEEKLVKLAPNVKQFSQALDEQQEKELEQELEEQRFEERPPAVKAATPIFDESLKKLILDGVTAEYMKSQRSLISIAASLGHTQLYRHYNKKNKNAWAEHLFVTKDFKMVIDSTSKSCDDFLRPVWWIARIKSHKGRDILVLLSSYECNHLFSIFQKSKKSTLFMYRPRLSKLHSNLLHENELQVTGSIDTENIDIMDEVQIGMYAGLMYFGSEAEQNAYCGFMGLIPRPRAPELEGAFQNGVIESKGYVPIEKRRYSEAISNCVGQCKFQDNPVDLAIKLIEAYHQTLLKESHVASIFERNQKLPIKNIIDDEYTNGKA